MPQPRLFFSRFGGAVLLTIAALLLSAGAAHAQGTGADKADQAEAFYIQAIQLYNAGRYREALGSFDRAIELQPDPIFFCNRSAVLLKLKEHSAALDSLRRCRADFTSEDEGEVATVDAEVQALALSVERVGPKSQRIALALATAPEAAPRSDDNTTLTWFAWGTAGFAGLTLGAALALDLATVSLIDEYEDVAATGRDAATYNDLQSVIQQRRVLIGSLVAVGALSAVTSGVLFWLLYDTPPAVDAPAASILPIQGGAAVLLDLPF